MRQFQNPWMHWSDFAFDLMSCDPPRDGEIRGEGLTAIGQVGVPVGASLGGIPIDDLAQVASGHDFSSFIQIAMGAISQPDTAVDEFAVRGEPYVFDSAAIVCESALGGFDSWERYRKALLERGFPSPHNAPDVLDPARRSEALADFDGLLARSAATDPFDLAAGLMSAEAAEASGFVPSQSDDAPTILRRMCVRCHDGATDPGLGRARFNVDKIGVLTPDAAAAIWARVTAPRESPGLMPPLRAGELSPSAIAKIDAFLRNR